MSRKNSYYMWIYFTKDTNETCAMCKICDKTFTLRKSYNAILSHIREKHSSNDSTVTSKVSNSQKKIRKIKKDEKRPYSITKDNRLKCDFCKKSYKICYSVTNSMKYHLKTIHKIDENTAQKHRKLCHEHVKPSSRNNTMTCNYCKKVFENNNYFSLMIHLINVHEIDISMDIRSVGLNDGSSCLPDIEVNDTDTLSNLFDTEINDIVTSNFPSNIEINDGSSCLPDIEVNNIITPSCLSNTEVNDTDTLSNLFDTEINDIVTSNFPSNTEINDGSSCLPDIEVNNIITPSCLSNTEVNDTDTLSNLFDTEINDTVTSNFSSNTEINDGSNCLPDIEVNNIITPSCLSNTEVNDTDILSNLFDTVVNDITSNFPSNAEVNDIDTSSTYQQSHTIWTYNLEYNLNNSSKSNRNAENIATLNSYQQPTFSSDDSFNCDDYDNIDNFDSLLEECLKELKK